MKPGAAGPWHRLESLVDWERADRSGMRPGLAPQFDLLARLGKPHRAVKTVHVTGTKGKGSVCALIEAGLLHAGLRAGRYASPHIVHVTERISLLGRPVDEPRMAQALTWALDARDAACAEGTAARDASWFDVVTAAALRIFADEGLDWAVVEVGLGGRLDSTNVVTPELAVITNVGLEHTDVLGSTVEEIAREKGGIIKPGRPVLTAIGADDPAGGVLRAIARQVGSPLTWVDTSACPGFTEANLALARAALDQLGRAGFPSPRRQAPLGAADLPPEQAAQAGLPGRAEVLEIDRPAPPGGAAQARPPLRVIVDGAHVGFALSALIDEFRGDPRHASAPVVLLALSADKDAADIVSRLVGVASLVVCTELGPQRRAWPAADLARLCEERGLPARTIAVPSEALAWCLDALAAPGPWLLVTGSLYLVAELRPRLLELGARAASLSRPARPSP